MEASVSKENRIFFNHIFDKKRLKALISWVFKQSGEAEALRVIDLLKETGFRHATRAGISIGLHDLMTPIQKSWLISESQLAMNTTESDFVGARITATERSQRIIDTWHRASESLSKEVVDYFGIYDRFNPVYIMALSGARGNFSQVRQLIGMRGLMADQQGKIVNFPIRSNLREGLTLTEYFISCSGARKGLVDTALRTADTGYLTRRLVDVSHHVVVKRIRCNTNRGIAFKSLQSYNKVLLSLKERLVGRVLAEDVWSNDGLAALVKDKGRAPLFPQMGTQVAKRDQEISLKLALKIAKVRDEVWLRSPLTCGFTHSVCQLCYGWSISQGSLVSLGDAVGVIAAQSIGEPGTQLTMRTFHTGGVFSGDLLQEIRAPHAGKIEFSKAFQGLLTRTAHGRIAFLSKTEGSLFLRYAPTENKKNNSFTTIPIPAFTMLFVRQGEKVENNQLLAEFSIRTKEGNQPIKTQQTIFAQLSGKVVEDRSGKVYTKSIKESRLLLHTLESQDPSDGGKSNTISTLAKKAVFCKQHNRKNSYKALFEGGASHLHRPVLACPKGAKKVHALCVREALSKICTGQQRCNQMKKCNSQNNKLFLSQIRSLNVPHNAQNELLQNIFDPKLGRWGTPGKRFVFLNEVKKKQSPICKAQLFSLYKNEDLENDAFKYVEPVRSGRLGFLKILSTRVGATLDYMSPIKSFDISLKKRKRRDAFEARFTESEALNSLISKTQQVGVANKASLSHGLQNRGLPLSAHLGVGQREQDWVGTLPFFSTFTSRYLHPEFLKDNRFFLQTIAEYGDIVEEGYSSNREHFNNYH